MGCTPSTTTTLRLYPTLSAVTSTPDIMLSLLLTRMLVIAISEIPNSGKMANRYDSCMRHWVTLILWLPVSIFVLLIYTPTYAQFLDWIGIVRMHDAVIFPTPADPQTTRETVCGQTRQALRCLDSRATLLLCWRRDPVKRTRREWMGKRTGQPGAWPAHFRLGADPSTPSLDSHTLGTRRGRGARGLC